MADNLLKASFRSSVFGPGTSHGEGEFSERILEQGVQRLAVMALVVAVAVVLAMSQNFVYFKVLDWGFNARYDLLNITQACMLVFAIVLFVLAKSDRLDRPLMLNIGCAYEFVAGFLLAFPFFFRELNNSSHFNPEELSWVCIWVTMWALVIPQRPIKAVIVAYATSTTPVISQLIWIAMGNPMPEFKYLVFALAPHYFVATISVFPAYLIWRNGVVLSQAQKSIETLGSYRLIECLGTGGMGEVWKAEHVMLARPAAIKIVKASKREGVDDAKLRRALGRFELEAKATAALTSPHTVRLFDYGTSSDGTFYYVMELLYGMDLETIVQEFGPLSPSRTIHLLAQVCDSLAEAHHNGLIHRDIKPANIYVCRVGLTDDFVKVFDFGLVFEKSEETNQEELRLTGHGNIVGTPTFMAPEMTDKRPVDGRTDIYSLGCVAYWLLTGEFVFQADTAIQMVVHHLQSEPIPIYKRTSQPIPEQLNDVIMQCLAKNPADRPADALELKHKLLACPIGGWRQSDARKWWKENHGKAISGEAIKSGSLKTWGSGKI